MDDEDNGVICVVVDLTVEGVSDITISSEGVNASSIIVVDGSTACVCVSVDTPGGKCGRKDSVNSDELIIVLTCSSAGASIDSGSCGGGGGGSGSTFGACRGRGGG
jgi:hypothetical protein